VLGPATDDDRKLPDSLGRDNPPSPEPEGFLARDFLCLIRKPQGPKNTEVVPDPFRSGDRSTACRIYNASLRVGVRPGLRGNRLHRTTRESAERQHMHKEGVLRLVQLRLVDVVVACAGPWAFGVPSPMPKATAILAPTLSFSLGY